MIDEYRVLLIAGALATACSSASSAGPAGGGGNRGDATGLEADGGQLTDSSASSIDGPSADGGPGEDGADGSAAVAPQNANNYDGARPTTVSFDAAWKFHLGDVTGAQATTFDDSSWTALDVPHDWSISLPFDQNSPAGAGGGYLDGGVGWYRKTFTLPPPSPGQRVIVQFDGAYMDSTVYMNGTQVCARPYGFISYECDFTSSAKFGGSNVLAVRLNNQQPSSRWYSGSGIFRHTWLKTVNPVRVAYTGTQVSTPQVSATSATVNVSVTLQNDGATAQSVSVASSVLDTTGAQVAQGSAPATTVDAATKHPGTATVTQTMTVPNPKLWSLASPALYSMVTTVTVGGAVVDTYTTSFGIRTFAFDANNGFTLNGQSVKLNGTCNHHDLGALGAAVNYRAIEKRLQMLKDMGVNALRTSHNPPAPEFLDIADRLGFLVMDEAFDCWDQGKNSYDYGRFFNQWGTTDIGAMVMRDRNHPSIIIWSIGNEIPDNNNATVAQSLISAVKAKDITRVIGQAFAEASPGAAVAPLEDVVGLNYAPYVYDSLHSSNPTWKFFASESSSAVRSRGIYEMPVTSNILTSSTNQCSSYDNSVVSWGTSAEGSWQGVNTSTFIAGEFIWTGFDYIGEPTPYGWPSKSSYFGAIDTAGFPKDIYYFYQSRWNRDGPTMVHIAPMDWTAGRRGNPFPSTSTAMPTAWSCSSTAVARVENGGCQSRAFRLGAPAVDRDVRHRDPPGEGHQERHGRRHRHRADGRLGGGSRPETRPHYHHGGRARPFLRRGRHRRCEGGPGAAGIQHDCLLGRRSGGDRGRRQRQPNQSRIVQGRDAIGLLRQGARYRSVDAHPRDDHAPRDVRLTDGGVGRYCDFAVSRPRWDPPIGPLRAQGLYPAAITLLWTKPSVWSDGYPETIAPS